MHLDVFGQNHMNTNTKRLCLKISKFKDATNLNVLWGSKYLKILNKIFFLVENNEVIKYNP